MIIPSQNIAPSSKTTLGITASHKRNIKSGSQYNKYFANSKGNDQVIDHNATTYNTIDFIAKNAVKTAHQATEIAKVLQGKGVENTSRKIFDFFYNHFQYKLDKNGVEQVRNLNRAWKDRASGIDCDCFTHAISQVLVAMGVPHILRKIKIKGRPYYQHIYVIVPKNGDATKNYHWKAMRDQYIVIDPVLDQFDKEADSITAKHDVPMQLNGLNGMQLQYLNGAESGLFNEFENLGYGLAGSSPDLLVQQFEDAALEQVINTRNAVKANPVLVASYINPGQFVNMLNEAIANWSNPVARENTLTKLANIEENISAYDPSTADEDLSGMYIDGMGILRRNKKSNKPKRGFFSAVKNGIQTVKNKVNNSKIANSKIGQKLTSVNKTLIENAKNVGKAVGRYNPLSAAARLAFIMALKVNLGQMATKLAIGRMGNAEAKKYTSQGGIALAKQAYQKTMNMWVKVLQGKPETLTDAINQGKSKRNSVQWDGKSEVNLSGLGAVAAAASSAAAIPFLTKVWDWIKGINVGEFIANNPEAVDAGQSFFENRKKRREAEAAAEAAAAANTNTNSFAPNEGGAVEPQPDFSSRSEKADNEGMSTPVKIGIGVGVAGLLGAIGYFAFGKKGKKKGMGSTQTATV